MALFRKPTAKSQFWGSFWKIIWKHFNLKVICNSAFYSWLIIVYYTTCMCLGDDCVHVHWTVSPYSITYKSSGLNKVGSRNNLRRGQNSISGKTFLGTFLHFEKNHVSHINFCICLRVFFSFPTFSTVNERHVRSLT